jgi:DNA-binding GntR family transcriptional regulator
MAKAKKLQTSSGSLVKSALANRLRDEISSGALQPGVRIIEGTWGRKLGVAQASIREAINLLAQEGFVTKVSGRSARVVRLTEQDVLQLYEVRGAVEGLAARLAASRHAAAKLQKMVDAMRRGSRRNRTADLVDADREFHLELCRLSANPHLVEHASRVLLPFFAFASSQASRAPRLGTAIWRRTSGSWTWSVRAKVR